jgi:hypothetical protein
MRGGRTEKSQVNVKTEQQGKQKYTANLGHIRTE